MTPALRDRLERCRSLPTPPSVGLQVIRLTERTDFGLSDLGRTLSAEPGLAAKMVRMLNVPVFGMRKEVTSLQQGLMFLGALPASNFALALLVVRDLRRTERPLDKAPAAGNDKAVDKAERFDYERFWKRSLHLALAQQALGRALGLPRADESFLAALLQDLGMLALAQAIPEAYPGLLSREQGDHGRLIEAEKLELGGSHAEVTGWLLTRWRFPAPVRELVDLCHASEAPTPKRTDEKLARCLQVSALIADGLCRDDAALAEALRAEGRTRFELGPDALAGLVVDVAAAYAACAPLFELPEPAADEVAFVRDRLVAQLRGEVPNDGTPSGEIDPAESGPVPVPAKPTIDVADSLEEEIRDRLAIRHEPELLEDVIGRLRAEATAQRRPLSVIACDIDNFAAFNASAGREVGDQLIKSLGHWLRMRLRGRDILGRLAGAGFVLVLVETALAGAEMVAERMRKQIEETGFRAGAQPGASVRITVSCGCAALEPGMTATPELLSTALLALRAAKSAGRNRVIVAPSAAQLQTRGAA